ncbi:MAG: GH25 family lysozyme [Clostridiaceae bacterium]|nr:GH25 family lysozyme [Clostridiaceae bacterium]
MAVNRIRMYRFVSILLICLLIISWSSMAMAFADTEGHWAENAIDRWSKEYGIFLGSGGLFRPNSDITRAEMAVLLDRLLGYKNTTDEAFSDVSPDEWYAGAISRLHEAGVLLGDGRYANPKGCITREQAVVMLVRAFALDTKNGAERALSYADADEISSWALEAVGAMTAAGYIQGNDGRFSPKSNLTRAEAVTIFDNLISGVFSEGGVYTEYMSGSVIINSERPVVLRDMTIEGSLYISYNAEVPLTLDNVTIRGEIVNFSGIDPIRFGSQEEDAKVTGDYITYESYQIEILQDVPRNPYDEELFFKAEDGRTYYASGDYEVLTGIDVSAWQKDIDWELVAQQGIDYAMLRVGYRGYTEGKINEDPYFRQNIEGALAAGLHVGVYFFSQAVTEEEAVEEARFVLDCIAPYDITFPVVFDWEPVSSDYARTNGLSGQTLCDSANAFSAEIKVAGYIPMIYFNLFAGYLKYDLSQLTDYDFWLAQYADTPSFYYDFQMWQYTSGGTVPGIKGGVDMNLCFVNYAKR